MYAFKVDKLDIIEIFLIYIFINDKLSLNDLITRICNPY